MADWVDFDAIKAQVSMEQILERYNLLHQMKQKGQQLIGLCPFHKNSKPSFKVTPERGIWHCFGCDLGGDVIEFVRLREGYTDGDRNSGRRRAALLIAEWYGIKSTRPDRPSESVPQRPSESSVTESSTEDQPVKEHNSPDLVEDEVVINPPLQFELKNLDPEHPYLNERGLTPETITTFGLGYFGGKGTMSGRIVIPIHNQHGELIAYAGRWPGDEGWPEHEDKYKLPKGFHKSHVLYNLHRAREHAAEGLIVVEGFFSVYDLWAKGRRNVVASMGASLSSEQERLIVDTVGQRGRVLLAFDPDDAGRRGMTDAAARLTQHCFVRVVELRI
jgi:DNA primase